MAVDCENQVEQMLFKLVVLVLVEKRTSLAINSLFRLSLSEEEQ